MLVAADLQRPAAIQQLQVLGQQLGIPVYADLAAKDPVALCQIAVKQAKATGVQVVILDTAGRCTSTRVDGPVDADRPPHRAGSGLSWWSTR